MAKRPPSGPAGNAPRDVRDDFVGVPADPVKAGPPPRWPTNPKKVKGNTFHAKVTGGNARARADRTPHFRKGGWVSGYAAGGVIAKREELPGEEKNDPFAKQNLKRGGAADSGVTESGYKRGGVLSAKQRQSLPSSSFALPGKGKGPKGAGAGSYPIPDASHARNALARVSQHGSSGEKATVRAKVKAKFPGIGQSK